jgi:pyridoxamine 5'-phosphate oxidase
MKTSPDPYVLFNEWFALAEQKEPDLPTAVALATASADGLPSLRMVLLKGVDERGFVFYTNFESRKGTELTENPHAALCFHWKSLNKQVRVQGTVEPVSEAEAEVYFASRDRASQIGAWASKQSRTLEGRFELEAEVAKFAAKFHIGKVARPSFWSGFRVKPVRIEFWSEGKFRLHERVEYERTEDSWTTRNLFP